MGNTTMCPGQDTRFWRPGDIYDVTCGKCGRSVEFFKDEASRRCPQCGTRLQNPKLALGCAQWCEHAKECLGFDPRQMKEDEAEPEAALVDKLIAAMRGVFRNDQKRIEHALKVLEYAKELLRSAEGNPRVVMTAAVLHDIGIIAAEQKRGSSAGVYQEMEGPPIAEKIMKELSLDQDTIDHVKKIIANHHSARDIDTPEFRVIWDADWLVNLPEEHPDLTGEALNNKIEKIFRTAAGKQKARAIFIDRLS